MDEIVISERNKGQTFNVRQGDPIVFSLAENPSTGYRWEIAIEDAHVVKLQGSDFVTSPRANIGAGGTRTFTLEALLPGTSMVRLTLRRAWESLEAAVDHFEVLICVQNK
jgi:inhibitor of cysteine peptidase